MFYSRTIHFQEHRHSVGRGVKLYQVGMTKRESEYMRMGEDQNGDIGKSSLHVPQQRSIIRQLFKNRNSSGRPVEAT